MEIKYNFKFSRWEVYRENPIVRAGEPQPSFVSKKYYECEEYIARVEAYK